MTSLPTSSAWIPSRLVSTRALSRSVAPVAAITTSVRWSGVITPSFCALYQHLITGGTLTSTARSPFGETVASSVATEAVPSRPGAPVPTTR